jgi:hypothetical protein
MREIDETTLSYAEIKALATGDPRLIERSNLETEVNRLRILKSGHLSQRYELEDKILKEFPADIARLEGIVNGYKTDIEHLEKNTPVQTDPEKPIFAPMTIEGVTYTAKKDAGCAILEACKAMKSPDPVPLGEYRGFKMELEFSRLGSQYILTLKNALSHSVTLGDDVFGNITRIDNELERMPEMQKLREVEIDHTKSWIETAKAEIAVPFHFESELADKEARLSELTIELKMHEQEHEILDAEPDEVDNNGDMGVEPKQRNEDRDER